jgi:hypothetical protein
VRKHQGINRVTPNDRYTGRSEEIIKKRDEIRKKVIKMRQSGKFTEREIQEDTIINELIDEFKRLYTQSSACLKKEVKSSTISL